MQNVLTGNERVSWTWVATVLPRTCQLNLGGHCSTENVSVKPGWPLFYRERVSWTWVATVLPRTSQLNLGGHCSTENVSVEPGWPLFYRERVSWTWVATVLPRTCQLNLGGHCSTENVSVEPGWPLFYRERRVNGQSLAFPQQCTESRKTTTTTMTLIKSRCSRLSTRK